MKNSQHEFRLDPQCPAAISVPADAPRTVVFAAAELKRYLENMLGMVLPQSAERMISLDVCRGADIKPEGYRIIIEPTAVIISGGDPAGALYGVYELLRRFCGCRFANPGDGELVPRHAELRLPCGTLIRNPLLWYRAMQIVRKTDPQTMIRQIDWMAKMGLNYIATMPAADDVAGGGVVDRDPETMEARPQNDNSYTDAWFSEHIVPAIRERGMKICMATHNFRRWISPHKYFAGHPEWFALVNGKRDPMIGQLCLCTSNRAMTDELIKNVLCYLRKYPEVRMVGISPEDGYGCCQCEACRALDAHPDDAFKMPGNYRLPEGENRGKSRRYALLINAVARAMRKEFPDIMVYYTAYVDLQWPPRDVLLETNVAVVLALYWRCAAHPIAADACPRNRFLFDLLSQWKAAHSGPLLVCDYYYGMNGQRGLPYPMAAMACRDWPTFRSLGIGGAKTGTDYANLAVYGLNYTAFARCGWEAHVEYESLRDEFLAGMFGRAAEAVKPVYQGFDRLVKQIENGQAGDSGYLKPAPPAQGCLLPNGRNIGYFLDEIGVGFIENCIQRAEQDADDAREQRQVARFKNALEYWKLRRAFMDCKDELQKAASSGTAPDMALEERCRTLKTAIIHRARTIQPDDGWGCVKV